MNEQKPANPEISVVIPCFNSKASLGELYDRLTVTLKGIGAAYEIIFVDDGSPDCGTWDVLQKLWQQDEQVCIIQHMNCFGQARALLTGMSTAMGSYIVTMDDDLQHPPEEIEKLYRAIFRSQDFDVVIGQYECKRHAVGRNLGSFISNVFSSYTLGKPQSLRLTSFRIIKRAVATEIAKIRVHNPRIGHLILLVTKRIGNIRVEHHDRKFGKSGYSLSKLISTALDNVLSQTAFPLQAVGVMGLFSAITAVVGVLYIFVRYLQNDLVPGWTSLIMVQLMLFATVMISMATIGEYLIRILRELQHTRVPPVRHIFASRRSGGRVKG